MQPQPAGPACSSAAAAATATAVAGAATPAVAVPVWHMREPYTLPPFYIHNFEEMTPESQQRSSTDAVSPDQVRGGCLCPGGRCNALCVPSATATWPTNLVCLPRRAPPPAPSTAAATAPSLAPSTAAATAPTPAWRLAATLLLGLAGRRQPRGQQQETQSVTRSTAR